MVASTASGPEHFLRRVRDVEESVFVMTLAVDIAEGPREVGHAPTVDQQIEGMAGIDL